MSHVDDKLEASMRASAARLERRFDGVRSAQEIEAMLLDAYQALAGEARVTSHLVTLAERSVREQLIAVSRAEPN